MDAVAGSAVEGRRWFTALLSLGVVTALAAALLQLVASGASRWSFAALSVIPHALAGASVVLLAALAARRWAHVTAAAVAVVVLSAVVLPRALPDSQPTAAGPSLVVAGANLYYGRADPQAVVDLVRAHDVDVLSLQELTPQAVGALDAAGLADLLPHRVFQPDDRAAGTGLASRYPLRALPSSPDSYHFQPVARVDGPGAGAEVVAVHVVAPVGRIDPAEWRAELAALPGSVPGRVLVGDFNATLDHRPLRRLLATGYRDAAASVGAGLRATWPTDTPLPPVAAIDHVLIGQGCTVRSFDVVALPGSDHHAVVAALVLP
ncbi:MAG: endonuclease/exonuclease/phosphatase family protein [Pseudonocardiaceae bacterium]